MTAGNPTLLRPRSALLSPAGGQPGFPRKAAGVGSRYGSVDFLARNGDHEQRHGTHLWAPYGKRWRLTHPVA